MAKKTTTSKTKSKTASKTKPKTASKTKPTKKAAAGKGRLTAYIPRLKAAVSPTRSLPKLREGVRHRVTCDGGSDRIDKISLNIGLGEASRNFKFLEGGGRKSSGAIAGQHATITRAKQVDRGVQAARRYADRLPGDASPRADVGFPRPVDRHGPASGP